jgi:hypothetical protein
MEKKHLKSNPEIPVNTCNSWTNAFLRAIKSPKRMTSSLSQKAEKECLSLFPYITLSEQSFDNLIWDHDGLDKTNIGGSECKMRITWKRIE